MALWLIHDGDGVATDEQFDDGLTALPGERGFTNKRVKAHARTLGRRFTFSLIGVPNWAPPSAADKGAAR